MTPTFKDSVITFVPPKGATGGGGGGWGVIAAHTNSVRTARVNNVNVRQNVTVSVNVSGDTHCCNNGWDDDYHPVTPAAAVGTVVAVTYAVVGSMVCSVPPGCVPVNYGAMACCNAAPSGMPHRGRSSSW